MQHHVACEVTTEDLLATPQKLRAARVTAVGGRRDPMDEPVVFSWMPAASVFFDDPDGNFLEYIAILEDEPQPELGLLLFDSRSVHRRIQVSTQPSSK
jgi:lactoylglutathione lyase